MYDKNKIMPEEYITKARKTVDLEIKSLAVPFACLSGWFMLTKCKDLSLLLLISYTICFYFFFSIIIETFVDVIFISKKESRIENKALKYCNREM